MDYNKTRQKRSFILGKREIITGKEEEDRKRVRGCTPCFASPSGRRGHSHILF